VGEQVKKGIKKMFEECRRARDAPQANLIEMLDADDLATIKANFAAALEKDLTRKKKSARVVSFNEAGRNKLCGTIVEARYEGLLAQITIDVGGQTMTTIITSDSARHLGLKKGVDVYALVKATEVMIIRE
jgi:molybdopterin-binding protein